MLSGGERNRLHLALTLKENANVLLLDEPTNDVDVNTIRALEEGLENFAGCAVVISHDRWFLDRITTHILAFEGDSKVYFFEGTYLNMRKIEAPSWQRGAQTLSTKIDRDKRISALFQAAHIVLALHRIASGQMLPVFLYGLF